MPIRYLESLAAACAGALLAAACASATAPPRFAPQSPADARAPEGALAPPRPILTEGGELADPPLPAPQAEP